MSVPKTLYGSTRQIPETDETDWGDEMTALESDQTEGLDEVSWKSTTHKGQKSTSGSATLAAGATITPTRTVMKVQGSGGAVALSAVTAIAPGETDGQELILQGDHAANTVSLVDGANVQLNGNITLGQYECLELRWDSTVGDWIEVGRST